MWFRIMRSRVWKENFMFFYFSHLTNTWILSILSTAYDGIDTYITYSERELPLFWSSPLQLWTALTVT